MVIKQTATLLQAHEARRLRLSTTFGNMVPANINACADPGENSTVYQARYLIHIYLRATSIKQWAAMTDDPRLQRLKLRGFQLPRHQACMIKRIFDSCRFKFEKIERPPILLTAHNPACMLTSIHSRSAWVSIHLPRNNDDSSTPEGTIASSCTASNDNHEALFSAISAIPNVSPITWIQLSGSDDRPSQT